MIIDRIDNLYLYFRMYPELEQIRDIVSSGIYQDGSTVVSDRMHYFISKYETHEKGLFGFESHRLFIDVQIILSGEEQIDISFGNGKIRSGYNAQKDIEFVENCDDLTYIAKTGMFILLMPGEYHEPCLCISNKPRQVKKLVFKIRN